MSKAVGASKWNTKYVYLGVFCLFSIHYLYLLLDLQVQLVHIPPSSVGSVEQQEKVFRKSGGVVDKKDNLIHLVFSTGCTNPSTEVSSLMMQQTAMEVGHRGPITRIVSGCTEKQQAEIVERATLYHDFRYHFTKQYFPHPVPNVTDNYSPYNKPFGMRDWLNNNVIDENFVALVDADFVFLKPLQVNTKSNQDIRYAGHRQPSTVSNEVKPGVALAQDWFNYMRGGLWKSKPELIQKICKGQPCARISIPDAEEYFAPTGPPYIFHISDARKFVDDYCHFTVEVRKEFKTWMSEMYGLAVAAANNNIKFTILSDVGITHPKFGKSNNREYWNFVQKVTGNPCDSTQANSGLTTNDLPVALHLCQHYSVLPADGYKWDYYKRLQPANLLSCNAPTLKVPPISLWDVANQSGDRDLKRAEVWTQCTVTRIVNKALTNYKAKACVGDYNIDQSTVMGSKIK